jgi:hypothetical protein
VDRGGGEQWLLRRPLGPLQRGGARRRLRRFLIHHYSPLITAIRHLGYSRCQRLSTSNHNMWWPSNQCSFPQTKHVVGCSHQYTRCGALKDSQRTTVCMWSLVGSCGWTPALRPPPSPPPRGGRVVSRAACKPGSVRSVDRRRWPSVWDAGCPAPLATATRGLGGRPANALLFGLAPDGVCLAGRSPGRRWALTPPFHPYRPRRPAVSFLWHFPSGHPDWALPSVLPCGARTFLPTSTREVERPPGRLDRLEFYRSYRRPDSALLSLSWSSIALFASASAPRFFSRGTCTTVESRKPDSSASASS